MIKRFFLPLLILLAPALAGQTDFFESLRQHPAARSAALALEATRQELANAVNYFALDASGGYISRDLAAAEPCPLLADPDPTNDVFCQFITPEVPETSSQSEIGLTLHAFAYGDLGDYQRTVLINYEIAKIDYRSNLANLEKGALEAAMQYYLALQARDLAKEGVEVSKAAYEATRIRYGKGAASDRDLRQAELALEQAKVELENSSSSLALAEDSLRYFTDSAPPPWPWPALDPPPDAEPPAVTKARLRREQARIGVEHSQRAFVPVGEIRFQHNLNDTSSVGVSVESRTLGARVYYAYQSYADPTRSRTDNELRLGFRLNFDQNDWGALEAARSRLEAAESGFEAAKEQSSLELARLQALIEQSKRRFDIAAKSLDVAERDHQEVKKRVELGLATPLEEQRSWLEYSKARLELVRAEQDVVRNRLALLAYLAIPPSEVWK